MYNNSSCLIKSLGDISVLRDLDQNDNEENGVSQSDEEQMAVGFREMDSDESLTSQPT